MWRTTQLLATVLCISAGSANATDQILTFNGLGPVRIGMTVAEAEKALGAKFKPMDTEVEDENCWITNRADDVDPPAKYMIWNNKIVRIDVWRGEPEWNEAPVPPVATQAGIHIGSTEREVKQKYGWRLRISPHYYDDNGHYMDVPASGRGYGLRFETNGNEVVNFHIGTKKAIELAEGCG